MSAGTLSTLAAFDDIRRCIPVLTDGTAEEEFLRVLELQDKFRKECLNAAHDAQRMQKELDASLQSMADLETKLFHARRLLEMETKARKEAEHQRDEMERKIHAVADLLQAERNLNNETRDKLAFLSTLPRKRKSLSRHLEEKYGNEINSTGSFFSDMSITQSEDDFLDPQNTRAWKKHRPSIPNNQLPCVGAKRCRTSAGGNTSVTRATTPSAPVTSRRSSARKSLANGGVQQHTLDVGEEGFERICATTTVTIPQDGNGAIRAESTIESLPLGKVRPVDGVSAVPVAATPRRRSPFKETAPMAATAPPMTPTAMKRAHNFATKTFIRNDTCTNCQKKIRFGCVALRCRDCPTRCHVECRSSLASSCVPQSGTPCAKGLIGDFTPVLRPMIPALIVHCVNEIETRGLQEVGIYRVSGSEREVKALKERFLRGKSTPNLSAIDVHVLCGCVKDFLRSLMEPLIPTELWKDFANAIQNPLEEQIQKDLFMSIDALPMPNRDTLAFLILHLQRVAECAEVRMPIENIARVFGPTIVGYSSLNPDQHAIFTEVYTQFNVMLNLLKIPTSYWTPFVSLEGDKENEDINANNPKGVQGTPGTLRKESLYSLYATPLKSTLKKRRFFGTPPTSSRK